MTNLHIAQPTIKSQLVKHSEGSYQLSIQPLTPGLGYTLGNSLRRIMLSSIPGFAVTRVRINDITHEYQPVKGIVEDALQIVLNLKLLRANIITDDESVVLTLKKDARGEIHASDFEENAKVKIINKDLYICSLDNDAELNIEVEISKGIGYLSSDQIKFASNTNPHDIYVDALFSPVSNVSQNVEQVRVGDKTNYDMIDLTFVTDETVPAKDIVEYALKLSIDTFQNILSSMNVETALPEAKVISKTVDQNDGNNDELDLPKRIKDILNKNEIFTNTDLIEKLSTVEDFAGITEKSFATIQSYIESLK
jgi:DNA-directed RNA polymerase subunit alpha